MEFFITIKQLGKRKPTLKLLPYQLENSQSPITLRDFILAIVAKEVDLYNSKQLEVPLMPFLLDSDIQHLAFNGKVHFGTLYNEGKANLQQAQNTAITAFTDGLFSVFVDEKECTSLDDLLNISTETVVIFIKLTLLSGQYH